MGKTVAISCQCTNNKYICIETIFQNRNSAELEGGGGREPAQASATTVSKWLNLHVQMWNISTGLTFRKVENCLLFRKCITILSGVGKPLNHQTISFESLLSMYFSTPREFTHSCYLPPVNHPYFFFKTFFFLNATAIEDRHGKKKI